jgi:DNA repair exonuclease SbcCD ATPase subunit
MLPGIALAVLALASAPDVDPADARAELDACARRIEELKARRQEGEEAGRELERLLRRAQDLAAELERTMAELPPASESPSPEELRERADEARDEADRLAAEIASLDVRIADARRMASSGPVQRAAMGGAPLASGRDRVRELEISRAALAELRLRAESESARLDAEARAAETDQ